MATKQKLEEAVEALLFHEEYDPKTKICAGGEHWCSEDFYRAPMPKGSPSIFIVWPAYWGMRAWLGLWGLIPALFGRRIGVTIVDGIPKMQLIKKGKRD